MKKLLLSLCLLICAFSWASDELQNFKLEEGSVNLRVPAGWQVAKHLFGVQLTLLGPMEGPRRPVITVDSTDFAEFHFDSEALKKNEESYREGRIKWLSRFKGEIKEFYPYEVKKILKAKLEDHVLGYRYIMGDQEFSETSHYIKCKKNLFHLKTLILASEEAKYKLEVQRLFDDFSCEEKGK